MLAKTALNLRLNENTQSIEELLISITKLSCHIMRDDLLMSDDEYPLDIRKRQVKSLKCLVDTLNETVEKVGID